MTSVAVFRGVSPPIHETLPRTERRAVAEWFAAGRFSRFWCRWSGSGLLELHHDLYLLVYFTVVGTFLASFAAHRQIDWRAWLGTKLWWSVGTGAVVAFTIVRTVLSDSSMDHPSGAFFWFETAWRGVLYGIMDALLLFVFPGHRRLSAAPRWAAPAAAPLRGAHVAALVRHHRDVSPRVPPVP